MIVKLEDGRIAFADDFGFAFLLTDGEGEEVTEVRSHTPLEEARIVEAGPADSRRADRGRRRQD